MADNGIWFKLWIGADEDPDLGDLSLEDFARWCKFGLYLKKYGTDGTVVLKSPCLALQHKFRVTSFDDVLKCISMFPNCSVTGVTNATVTWKNWQKYQGDNSRERVRKFRSRVTLKKRREEMRGDEKRREENIGAAPAAQLSLVGKPGTERKSENLPLPEWLSPQSWRDFCAFRATTKHPLSIKAAELTIKELTKLRDQGNDPTLVIEQSIMMSWRGLFPLKEEARKEHEQKPPEIDREENGEVILKNGERMTRRYYDHRYGEKEQGQQKHQPKDEGGRHDH